MNQVTLRKGYLYLLLTFVIWGSLYVVSKFVLGKMPTGVVAFCRFFIAFFALAVLQRGKSEKIEKKDYKYVFLLGVVGYFIAVGAQLLGTRYAGASMASLINALNPVTMTFFAVLFLREKLTMRKIIGIFFALTGVYIILGKGGGKSNTFGILLSLVSVIIWSMVSVLTKKISQKYKSITITKSAVGIAAICYLPVCILEVVSGEKIEFSASGIISLLYMGVVCTGISFMLWNKSLSIVEAGTCSAFYPLQPFIATLLGVLFLKETIGLRFLLGSVLIVMGVLINLCSSNQTRE